jgi:multidrug efflux pump subunit AcrB
LRDVADWHRITTPAEYDRLNQQRFITLTANVHQQDLGTAVVKLDQAIDNLGELPAGVRVLKRGQVDLLNETLGELQQGLLIAIVVIFLVLAANFQSFRISLATISILPAVIGGSILVLLATGHSLNIQSYMGAIMAVGVAVANSILYITNAEDLRKQGDKNAFFNASANRIRPILMTSFAMIAGMTPMALGLGEGGDQVAPLGVAVIGGLIFSMISTLIILPLIYRTLVGRHPFESRSLNPQDSHSKYFEKN